MTDDALAADRAISDRLPRVWAPFFGRFGRLTETQRLAIPHILAGESVLVCAPTAAGKTEAACAPLVECNLGRQPQWTILYISPTRALVNDLFERLRVPLDQLHLRIARRTGDHRDPITHVPHVLLTTPESFDSLLCRGRKGADPHALAHVVAVVLDEIHLLHARVRGEQIRWLLERLRRLRQFACEEGWCKNSSFQTVALSATVPDPDDVAKAYLSGGHVVHAAGGREIDAISIECEYPSVEFAVLAYVQQLQQPEKILVFSNSRKRVEQLTLQLRAPLGQYGYAVRAHHGSLAVQEREAAEAAVKTERKITVFATSTLEIGVDIGDIDLVVLDGPAPDVGALLQRIGRGNRRTNRTRVMLCANSMAEVLIQSAMLDAARASFLGPLERGPCYSVARQQVASYIFQAPTRSRRPETLVELITACAPGVAGQDLLDHLVSLGELESDDAGIRLGREWLDATASGEIHSNIEGQAGYTVVDQGTGAPIATGVRATAGGRSFGVGGQLLEVKTWEARHIEVRKASSLSAPLGEWSYVSRGWVEGPGQPQAVRRYLGLQEDMWPVLLTGTGARVFHFGGARRMAVLNLICSKQPEARGTKADAWSIWLPSSNGTRPRWLTGVGPALVDMQIPAWLDRLEKLLGLPNANAHLPLNLRISEVRQWLNVEKQVQDLLASQWVIQDSEETVAALSLLDRVLA